MMKIVIIGAGGHGRVVLSILRANHQFDVVGFLDANPALLHQNIDNLPIIGDFSLVGQLRQMGIEGAIVAIGDNRVRKNYAEKLQQADVTLVSAIHPSATITHNGLIGSNVVIAAGVNVCAHTVIEDSVILNTGCIIDHESTVHKAVHICPGVKLAGHVTVQELAFVGIGAIVIQGITIGQSAVVGAGAVVLTQVPAFTTVVGVPARIVKSSHLPRIPVDVCISTADLEPARSLVKRPKRRGPPAPTTTLAVQEV